MRVFFRNISQVSGVIFIKKEHYQTDKLKTHRPKFKHKPKTKRRNFKDKREAQLIFKYTLWLQTFLWWGFFILCFVIFFKIIIYCFFDDYRIMWTNIDPKYCLKYFLSMLYYFFII